MRRKLPVWQFYFSFCPPDKVPPDPSGLDGVVGPQFDNQDADNVDEECTVNLQTTKKTKS